MHIVQTLIIRRILQRRIWLVDCFGFNGPLIQYFSLYNGPSPKEERNDRWELVGWLFWVLRPFETVFQSISGRLPKGGRQRRERIEEGKNVQTTPTRTYCKRNRPLPNYHPNCRTPRYWKFTQDHRTTRPPPIDERKMSKQPPPAPTTSAVGPCPTSEVVGRPGTWSLPSTIAPPDRPRRICAALFADVIFMDARRCWVNLRKRNHTTTWWMMKH